MSFFVKSWVWSPLKLQVLTTLLLLLSPLMTLHLHDPIQDNPTEALVDLLAAAEVAGEEAIKVVACLPPIRPAISLLPNLTAKSATGLVILLWIVTKEWTSYIKVDIPFPNWLQWLHHSHLKENIIDLQTQELPHMLPIICRICLFTPITKERISLLLVMVKLYALLALALLLHTLLQKLFTWTMYFMSLKFLPIFCLYINSLKITIVFLSLICLVLPYRTVSRRRSFSRSQ